MPLSSQVHSGDELDSFSGDLVCFASEASAPCDSLRTLLPTSPVCFALPPLATAAQKFILRAAEANLRVDGRKASWLLQRSAQLLEVSRYRYSETLSKAKPGSALRRAVLQGSNSDSNRKLVEYGQQTAEGINVTRRLGDLPGNICTPDFLAKESRKLARQFEKVKVSVLDEKKMQQLGMGALLSVSAGSDQPARLIAIEYQGAAKSQRPHVLVRRHGKKPNNL